MTFLQNLEREYIRDLLLKPTHPPNMHCFRHSAKLLALYVRSTGPVNYSQTSQHLKIASTTAYLEPGPLPLFQRLDVPRQRSEHNLQAQVNPSTGPDTPPHQLMTDNSQDGGGVTATNDPSQLPLILTTYTTMTDNGNRDDLEHSLLQDNQSVIAFQSFLFTSTLTAMHRRPQHLLASNFTHRILQFLTSLGDRR